MMDLLDGKPNSHVKHRGSLGKLLIHLGRPACLGYDGEGSW